MKTTNEDFKLELKMLETVGNTLLHENVVVRPITSGNEIGYTTTDGNCFIYLAEKHRIMDGLSDVEKKIFRKGVFAHELCHRFFTNFAYLREVLEDYTASHRSFLMDYINIVEDPAIEYFAHTAFGGGLLKSLYFTIGRIFKMSRPLEDSKSPFEQYLSALIQFGDAGTLKGEFTFPEAKDAFSATIKDFYKAISEPDNKKRIDMALSIFLKTKNLWENMSVNEIQKALVQVGKSSNLDVSSKSKGQNALLSGSNEFSKKRKRQKKTVIIFTEEDENDKKDSFNEDINEGDNASLSEEDSENENENSFSPLGEEELELLKKNILEDFRNARQQQSKSEPQKRNEAPVENGNDISHIGNLNNIICSPSSTDDAIYERIFEEIAPMVKSTVHSLKAILALDNDKIIHHNKGKLSAKNIYMSGDYISRKGKITENLFDKRIIPDDKSDFAVAVAVDISGSMSSYISSKQNVSRIAVAQACTIALAEIFRELHIPIYIMGFTADENKYDTVHRHYIRWNNYSSERLTLAQMAACSNNRDGPSIRYITRILDKRQAKHKLLFVISDGQPLANSYRNWFAVQDTKKAIVEAKAKFPVFGIAIGKDEDVLKSFYGNDFLIAKSCEDLLYGVTGKLKKILK